MTDLPIPDDRSSMHEASTAVIDGPGEDALAPDEVAPESNPTLPAVSSAGTGASRPGFGTRMVRGRPEDPSWARPALLALLAVTAAAYFWNLTASGNANSFYAAAVQAGTKSWKAFFFGSLDSSNFITVDKSPGSLWIMELSGRIFGFSSWSMLMPEVLEGVAAVALVYAAVKRWFGAPAGLIAGAVLACTPVAALMFRFNNPDAFMTLLLVAAAYTLIRALEKAGTKWLVATGALIGFAFLAKMLQSFTVLPAFALVYLVAAPTSLRRRLGQLAVAGAAVLVAAGWWVAIVALWPVADRPLIDGSPDNSILNLIFGYNGLDRLSGGSAGGGSAFSGSTGILRLFNDTMGGQASWLIPAALVTTVAGLGLRWNAPRTDRTRASLILWGGWLIVTGAVFSFSGGIIHSYYTVALAPAIAALVGIGAALLWQHRSNLVARLLGAATLLGSAVWSVELLRRSSGYYTWLFPVILVAAVGSAAALVAAPYVGRVGRWLEVAMVGLGLVACLSGPLAYTATTLATAHDGGIASAGPSVSGSSGGFGGAGGFPGGKLPNGIPKGGSTGGFPGGKLPNGIPKGGSTGGFPGGKLPSGIPKGGSIGGFGLSGGSGAGGTTTVSSALSTALRNDASSYRWVAATLGSESAASLELATDGEPVMAIGGFSGEGGNISLATFQSYIAKEDIHYFIASSGSAGPSHNSSSDSAITSWVKSHYKATTIGGQTVYNLTEAVK
jgi:4-amino-4-deoxy-L-arabinose transferase-like glycosyltransferase